MKKLFLFFVFKIFFLFNSSSVLADSYDAYLFALQTDRLVEFQNLAKRGLGYDMVMPDGSPTLSFAMKHGARNIVEYLLSQDLDIDINQIDMYGDSPLMIASFLGEQQWTIRLIMLGAEINRHGWTPLHYAAAKGQLSIVKQLLRFGADINARSPNCTTPLMMAARADFIEVVSLLLKLGANKALVNQSDFSAISYAEKNNNFEMQQLLK